MDCGSRQEIAKGVYFNSFFDDRFKTMRISANAFLPLDINTASANALLSSVLSHSCKEYPDFTILSRKLSSLYGAELSSSVRKAGDNQVITITAAGIEDKYAFSGESIALALSNLLCSVLFNPNVYKNEFQSDEVEQERRQLLDLVDSEFNDKRVYANSRLTEIMCKDETFGIKRYGTVEKIKEITPSSLYKTWKSFLKHAKFEILYIGSGDSKKAEEVFEKAFDSIDREPLNLSTQTHHDVDKIKRITEEMELAQSKLVMGLRTETAVPDENVNATRLMCAILGGTANSKLFLNVREKKSLCYYCVSRYNKNKGIMTIESGVQGENVKEAENGILKEIADMKNGVISDFEINSTKLSVINAFRSTSDTVSGIDLWYSNQLLEDGFKSVEEMSKEINAVTKQQIVDAAQKLTLDTIYVLKNK